MTVTVFGVDIWYFGELEQPTRTTVDASIAARADFFTFLSWV
jgi:hypothetical protein